MVHEDIHWSKRSILFSVSFDCEGLLHVYPGQTGKFAMIPSAYRMPSIKNQKFIMLYHSFNSVGQERTS